MAQGGFVESFFQTLQPLLQLEQQKKRDAQAAAQAAVDDELRRIQLAQQKENQEEVRGLRAERQADMRNAQEDRNYFTDMLRNIQLGNLSARMDANQIRDTAREDANRRFTIREANDVFSMLMQGGVDKDIAFATSQKFKESMDAPQPFGAQPTAGPLTLSGGQGMAQGAPGFEGVMPKVASGMEHQAALTDAALARAKATAVSTALNEERLAQLSANRAIEEAYKTNRNRLQEERLKQMPLEATAKRLQIDTAKLQAQLLRGQVDLIPVKQAIERLNLQKARKEATWTSDARAMRSWLEKEFSATESGMSNAVGHLRQLQEDQRQTKSSIRSLESKPVRTPDEEARLEGLRLMRDAREGSINFFSVEYGDFRKNRDSYRTLLDQMNGIDVQAVNSHGQVQKPKFGAVAPAAVPAPGKSLGGMKSVPVKEPPRPGNVPPGYKFRANGPKGAGWYKQ